MKTIIKKLITSLTIKALVIHSLGVFSTQVMAQSNLKDTKCPHMQFNNPTAGFGKLSNDIGSDTLKRLDKKYGTNYYPRCLPNVTSSFIGSGEGMNFAEVTMAPEAIGKIILSMEAEAAKVANVAFDSTKYNPKELGQQYFIEYTGAGYTNTMNKDLKLPYPELMLVSKEKIAEHVALQNKNKSFSTPARDITDYSGNGQKSSNTSTKKSIPEVACLNWNNLGGKVWASEDEIKKLQQFVNQYTLSMYEKLEKQYNADLSHCDKGATLPITAADPSTNGSKSANYSALDDIIDSLSKSEENFSNRIANALGVKKDLSEDQKKTALADIKKGMKDFAKNGPSTDASKTSGGTNPKQANNSVAAGSATTDASKADLTSGSIENKAAMSTLTMATIGLLTSRLYSCKMTADMYVAAAAGTAFIAGEIINFKDIKKSLKDLDAQVKKDEKEDYQTQIQAFYKLKEGYESAIKTSRNKTRLQRAAVGAFGAAAAAAGLMYAQNKAMLAGCTTSLAASSKACSAAFSASCATGCAAPLQTAATMNAAAIGQNTAADAKDSVPQLSAQAEASSLASILAMSGQNATAASMCPASVASKLKCDSAYTFKKNNAGVCPAMLSIASHDPGNEKNYIKLKDFSIPYPSYWTEINAILFPKAQASSTALLGLGAAAAAFVVGTSKVLGPKIDLMLYNPKNRAIIWATLAGLALTASNDTEGVIQQLKNRVKVIDDIIKSLENQSGKTVADGTDADKDSESKNTGSNSGGNSGGTGGSNGTTDSRVSASGGQNSKVNGTNSDVTLTNKLPCYTKTINGNCQSGVDAMKNTPSFSQLDSGTQSQFAKIARSLEPLNGASSLSGASLSDLDSLGASASNALSDLSKDLVQKHKIPQKDVNQIEAKKKELLDAVQNQLKKANSSPGAMYASFGGLGGFAPAGSSSGGLKSSDATTSPKYLSSGSTDLGGFGSGSGMTGLKGNDPKTFEDVSSRNGEVLVTSGSGDGANGSDEEQAAAVDLDLNDISKDKEKSIFSIISDRYQKTGYSRLTEKKPEEKKAIK